MARIVYGVMGDSRGHVARARTVAEQLPQHDFVFVGGGAVAELAGSGCRVIEVPVMGTAIGGGRVRVLATAGGALRLAPGLRGVIDRLAKAIAALDPGLIVTDYEFFTQMAARRLARTCVSLDNQHLLTLCRYKPPPANRLGRLLTLLAIRRLYSMASVYLVTSFCPVVPKTTKTTFVLPPLIRQKVRTAVPWPGRHGLVYLRGGLPAGLAAALMRRPGPFTIYGLGRKPKQGNLTFKSVDDTDFVRELAGCRYVVCNGGHATISEALFLGKPVFCTPVGLFYEQTVNAHLLAEAGYGAWHDGRLPWDTVLGRFEDRLDRYAARIGQGRFLGNGAVADRLEQLIGRR